MKIQIYFVYLQCNIKNKYNMAQTNDGDVLTHQEEIQQQRQKMIDDINEQIEWHTQKLNAYKMQLEIVTKTNITNE